jgi:hypothetical protein
MGDFSADLRTSGIYRKVIGRGLFRQPQQYVAISKVSDFMVITYGKVYNFENRYAIDIRARPPQGINRG